MSTNKSPITFLVVEDDDLDFRALTRALKKHSITNPLVRAKNGIEALELLIQDNENTVSPPYIIMLDLNMPKMNGFEFLEHARNNPVLSKSIIFVLTTSSSPSDTTKAYSKNVAGYLTKDMLSDPSGNIPHLLRQYCNTVILPTHENAYA